MEQNNKTRILLEVGSKRVFASALDWPGWSRSGRNEEQAMTTLFHYGPRYAQAISTSGVTVRVPSSIDDLAIIERVSGNTTTDFGAPNVAAKTDSDPLDAAELRRLQSILVACWYFFDEVAKNAQNRELRKGPRGGGRELEAIIRHVNEAEIAYQKALGAENIVLLPSTKYPNLTIAQQEVISAVELSAQGAIPAFGPRGGVRWKPRTFVRRVAWHVLDHAWEIEDRVGVDQSLG